MKLYDLLQVLIVGGAIFFSALYALARIAPRTRRRCGSWLMQSTRSHWLQYVGGKLAGDGGGCGTCNSCGPADKPGASANQSAVAGAQQKIPVHQL